TAVERLDHPPAGLVAGLVLEPQHPLPVEGRRAVGEADRVIGDLAPHPGHTVPRVDLPDAALGGGEDESIGRDGRPLGQGDDRGSKALLPAGEVGRTDFALHGGRSLPGTFREAADDRAGPDGDYHGPPTIRGGRVSEAFQQILSPEGELAGKPPIEIAETR